MNRSTRSATRVSPAAENQRKLSWAVKAGVTVNPEVPSSTRLIKGEFQKDHQPKQGQSEELVGDPTAVEARSEDAAGASVGRCQQGY